MNPAAPTQPPAPAPAPAPVPPVPVPTLVVKVDGLAVEVPRQMPHPITGRLIPTTMIQACEQVGVVVPHYCYHSKLPVAGNCRMCLVEYGTPALGPDRKPLVNPDGSFKITKAANPAIACATPVSPGMEIYTRTPGVEAARKAVLEFLLINHPLDCPICDQAGECKLQEYSVEYGQAESHFEENKVHKPKQVDLGPRLLLDDERCILCSRCIRFTRDIVGDDALGFVNRGSYTTLTHYPGRPFDNNYTLNTADLCPVGALTSKDFRFQMRVWFLKETKSLCTSCGTGCNLVIGSRENRIRRYVPRQNDAVNSCWMCDTGRLNYRWIERPDRLTQVLKRSKEGNVESVSWPAALQEIARQLAAAAPGAVAILGSARLTNEELFLIRQLACTLGATTDTVARQGEGDHLLVNPDKNPNSEGARLLGIAATPMGANIPGMAEAIRTRQIRVLLAFGENAARHIDPAWLRQLDLLVASDILPSTATELAHYVLPGCAHAEKRGTFTNARGRVQKFMKAVEPPGEARPDWEFLRELVERITGRRFPSTIEGLFHQMTQDVPAFRGLTWTGLGDGGAPVIVR